PYFASPDSATRRCVAKHLAVRLRHPGPYYYWPAIIGAKRQRYVAALCGRLWHARAHTGTRHANSVARPRAGEPVEAQEQLYCGFGRTFRERMGPAARLARHR